MINFISFLLGLVVSLLVETLSIWIYFNFKE